MFWFRDSLLAQKRILSKMKSLKSQIFIIVRFLFINQQKLNTIYHHRRKFSLILSSITFVCRVPPFLPGSFGTCKFQISSCSLFPKPFPKKIYFLFKDSKLLLWSYLLLQKESGFYLSFSSRKSLINRIWSLILKFATKCIL